MREAVRGILIAIWFFIAGLTCIFLPPVNMFWSILGIFAIIISYMILLVNIIVEGLENEE